MARFRYAVVLEPVPRIWFEHSVGLGHDTLGEYVGHLSPGEWQELDDGLQVAVDEWDRHGDTAGALHFADDHGVMTYRVFLTSASVPRRASLSADFRLAAPFGARWLTKGKGDVHLDLDRWWAGAASAIEGWGRFGPVRVSFECTAAPEPGGRWLVTGTGKLRGRGLLWPLMSFGVFIIRPMLRRQLAAGLDEFAEQWNREVPALLALSPDALRDRFLEELTNARS
jgi:hypothetical protein